MLLLNENLKKMSHLNSNEGDSKVSDCNGKTIT